MMSFAAELWAQGPCAWPTESRLPTFCFPPDGKLIASVTRPLWPQDLPKASFSTPLPPNTLTAGWGQDRKKRKMEDIHMSLYNLVTILHTDAKYRGCFPSMFIQIYWSDYFVSVKHIFINQSIHNFVLCVSILWHLI